MNDHKGALLAVIESNIKWLENHLDVTKRLELVFKRYVTSSECNFYATAVREETEKELKSMKELWEIHGNKP